MIYHDPDEWETEHKHHTCDHHKKNPGSNFAGCTCWSSYTSRRRTRQPFTLPVVPPTLDVIRPQPFATITGPKENPR